MISIYYCIFSIFALDIVNNLCYSISRRHALLDIIDVSLIGSH